MSGKTYQTAGVYLFFTTEWVIIVLSDAQPIIA